LAGKAAGLRNADLGRFNQACRGQPRIPGRVMTGNALREYPIIKLPAVAAAKTAAPLLQHTWGTVLRAARPFSS
jgi:hypothetical protein